MPQLASPTMPLCLDSTLLTIVVHQSAPSVNSDGVIKATTVYGLVLRIPVGIASDKVRETVIRIDRLTYFN